MTQNEVIIMHLEKEGAITSAEAMNLYGIARLASRVDELRKRGHHIKTTYIELKTRLGKKGRYASYSLERNKE